MSQSHHNGCHGPRPNCWIVPPREGKLPVYRRNQPSDTSRPPYWHQWHWRMVQRTWKAIQQVARPSTYATRNSNLDHLQWDCNWLCTDHPTPRPKRRHCHGRALSSPCRVRAHGRGATTRLQPNNNSTIKDLIQTPNNRLKGYVFAHINCGQHHIARMTDKTLVISLVDTHLHAGWFETSAHMSSWVKLQFTLLTCLRSNHHYGHDTTQIHHILPFQPYHMHTDSKIAKDAINVTEEEKRTGQHCHRCFASTNKLHAHLHIRRSVKEMMPIAPKTPVICQYCWELIGVLSHDKFFDIHRVKQ